MSGSHASPVKRLQDLEEVLILSPQRKSHARSPAPRSFRDNELQIYTEMVAVYQTLQERRSTQRHRSYKTIPVFHRALKGKKPSQSSSSVDTIDVSQAADDGGGKLALRHRLRMLARQRFLQRREEEALDPETLLEVSNLLEGVHSLPVDSSDPDQQQQQGGRINYDDFCQFVFDPSMPSSARRFLTAEHFLQLPRDRYGRINVADFVKHAFDATCLEKTRITLYAYDSDGKGYLRESDLENYIFDLIHTIEALRTELPESFYPFYAYTAVRRFFFFLDPKRTGKLRIEAMIKSRVMLELMEMGLVPSVDGGDEGEDAYVRQQRMKNWFSAENALRVYHMYIDLDEDQNGLLSRRELLAFGRSTNTALTEAFIDRVFEQSITYKLESDPSRESHMDFKAFIEFVLAMENKNTPQGLRYFFRVLDVQQEGKITGFNIRYFFKEVAHRSLSEFGYEAPNSDDVKDEIFDMARPKDPSRITYEDLVKCGVGHYIVSMLTDVSGFIIYDQRENTLAATQEEPES